MFEMIKRLAEEKRGRVGGIRFDPGLGGYLVR